MQLETDVIAGGSTKRGDFVVVVCVTSV
jgi:hypothetical protein